MDANQDGKVEKNEVPEPMQRMLGRLDTNGDGAISKEEAEAADKQFGGGAGGGPARGGRPQRPQRPGNE
ncbi:MAG: hypothetical protein HQ581_25630 [Planctomycetes bacterium]|nr:hypothetical protein [Planctomycetota bacterium]